MDKRRDRARTAEQLKNLRITFTQRIKSEPALAVLEVLCQQRRITRFHAITDTAQGGTSVLANLPQSCEVDQLPGQRCAVLQGAAESLVKTPTRQSSRSHDLKARSSN